MLEQFRNLHFWHKALLISSIMFIASLFMVNTYPSIMVGAITIWVAVVVRSFLAIHSVAEIKETSEWAMEKAVQEWKEKKRFESTTKIIGVPMCYVGLIMVVLSLITMWLRLF